MDPANVQGSGAQQKMRSLGPPRYDGADGNPLYDTNGVGHYGASASIAGQGHAPPPEVFSGAWGNVNQGLSGNYRDILNTYWQQQITKIETADHDYKQHHLPLARIKKVMKADPEVKMISAEAPILFAEGCDIFITELTMRAWIHAEENKRRTLQRSDIASALAKSDMFDFLIDIVPREETAGHKPRAGTHSSASAAGTGGPASSSVSTGVHPPPSQQHQQQQQPGMPPHPSSHPHPHPHPHHQQHPHPHHQQQQQQPHPNPMGAPEYGIPPQPQQQQLPPEPDYRPQPGIYAQPVQTDPTGAGYPNQPHQPQMFDQAIYGGYAIPPQQMYQVGQRPSQAAAPGTGAVGAAPPPPPPPDPGQQYRGDGSSATAEVGADEDREYVVV